MSISNQTDKVFGSGNGSNTIFGFPFKIFQASDLVVYETDTTQTPNVDHGPLVLGTDYTVQINTVGEGGTVTFTVAPPNAWQTLIQRVVEFTQSLELNTEGNLPAQQIENQLDLMTMMCIQVEEAINRSLQLPVTFNGTLPQILPNPQANLVLMWDPTGTVLVNGVATAIGTIAVPISNGNISTINSPNKVDGAALFNLQNIPAGAGIIPVANVPTGVTANKVLMLDGSAKIPAVDGSELTNVVASANAPLNGNQLGAWGSTLNINQVYQAATDGFVVAQGTAAVNPTNLNVHVVTDNSATPSTVRTGSNIGSDSLGNGHVSFSVVCPIRKGDYWEVVVSSDVSVTGSVYFLPMGS